jgi:hypothetical protein
MSEREGGLTIQAHVDVHRHGDEPNEAIEVELTKRSQPEKDSNFNARVRGRDEAQS